MPHDDFAASCDLATPPPSTDVGFTRFDEPVHMVKALADEMPRSRPPIKNGIDLQLQSACAEGNWLVVLRLAEKRSRTSKDQYYEILKVVAISQSDDPSNTFAAVAAVWQYVKDGTVIKDVDALDLLEWSCQDHLPEKEFPETLGLLRSRAVKAGVKNKQEASRCLESCLLHWDLVNAQQIAAMMDRTYPQERKFMFWNIAITHMLSTNKHTPPEKKKLYGMLAQKQIERAAQAFTTAEQTSNNAPKPTARTVQSEEEILLLYDVVEKHGSPEDLSKLVSSPEFGPVQQFRRGRKELFMRTLRRYVKSQDWSAVFDICKQCLQNGDGEGVDFLAADWSVWQQFIEAASHLESVDKTASSIVQELLLRFAQSSSLRPIYSRNVLLARLAAVFTLVKLDGPDAIEGQPASLRLIELVSYLKDQFSNSACFNDVKTFIERLDGSGLQWLATSLDGQLRPITKDDRGASRVNLLSLKVRYLVATCHMRVAYPYATIDTLLDDVLSTYQQLRDSGNSPSGILSELAILVALCYVDEADLSSKPQPLNFQKLQSLYHAILILEEQLEHSPKDSVILLLLVQLHLRVGSAYRARILWDSLGVKRTIVDCLAFILHDRLSTISPSLLSRTERRGYELSECVSSHYEVSLKHPMPRRLIDAFEAESYSSVLKIPEYIENLRNGCTRVMSLVEDARTERLLEGPGMRVLDDPRYTEVTDDLELKETIDFGSYPSWAVSDRQPVYLQLQLGPSPTNIRAHLSLLAEAFQEVLSYKPPVVYKVVTSATPVFILEQMAQIGNSLSTFLSSADACVTLEELTYFNLLASLANLISLSATLDRSQAEEILLDLTQSAHSALETLKSLLTANTKLTSEEAFLKLGNLHCLTMVRDSACATKLTCQWIMLRNDREKERDRSGQAGLPKDLVAQIKRLQAASDELQQFGKEWLASLHKYATGTDLRRDILVAFQEEKLLPFDNSRTVDVLIESWKRTLKGWKDVRWE